MSEFVDLDAIVKTWAWNCYKADRKENKYTKDDVIIDINWKNTYVEVDEPEYVTSAPQADMSSQVLFRSYYTNRTRSTQEHTFKTERRLNSSCGMQLERGVTRECGLSFSLGLPDDVAGATASFGRSVTVSSGSNQTIEQEVTWAVDSLIKVRPRRRASAALVVSEHCLERNFTVALRLRGFLFALISSPKQERLKMLQGEICSIFGTALKNGVRGFEVENGRVHCSISGSCKFRFGVEQHVEVQEEKLKDGGTSDSEGDEEI